MATTRVDEGTAKNMAEEPQEQPQPVRGLGWIGDIRRFFHEVVLEMKKVSWPSRTEVANTTLVVIIAVFFFSFYLFGTDLALSYMIQGIEWVALKIFG
jgi:preprotein translocase subunit SecE